MFDPPQTGPPTEPTPGTPQGEAQRRGIDAVIQEIILELTDRCAGRPIEEIAEDFEARLAERGITGQPPKWIEAVARDASAGRVYVTSTDAVDDVDRLSAQAAGGPSETDASQPR